MPIHGYPGNIITANPTSPSVSSASGVWTTEQQMQAMIAGNWPMAATQISRSLRFNSADSAYLNRTPGSAGNRKTFTWSGWVKRSALGTGSGDASALVSVGTNTSDDASLYFSNTNSLVALARVSSSIVLYLISTQVFRDVSSWYHVVIAVDTTQTTASNRVKMYVNGTQITSFSTETYPNQNQDLNWNNSVSHDIGRFFNQFGAGSFFNGYMTEVNFIDGQALTPASFGVTDPATGVWGPRQYTGPYGTNGFYLNFSDNSGTTSTTLGKDYSGNGNNWTPNNFSVTAGAGNDSLVDTPTPYGTDTGAGGEVRGNYCTLNPLNNGGLTLSNGNLDSSQTNVSANYQMAKGTIGMSTGKWYWEVLITNRSEQANSRFGIGISNASEPLDGYVGATSGGYSYFTDSLSLTNAYIANSGSFTLVTGAGFTTNDILMFAYDADNGKIWFGKNGTWLQSGAPASGTNPQFSSIPSNTYFPAISNFSAGGATAAAAHNLGQRPFAYTAPSGFKALCTQNLPTPTIGATSATMANKYMDVVLRTSNGNVGGTYSTTVNMSNGALLWDKARSINSNHYLLDSVRGISKTLSSDTTGAEANYPNWFTNFGSSSFTTGSDDYTAGTTVVDWIWAANGSGSSNTAGSISSTVSASTLSGFSIVTYVGTGSAGTIGHGLGATPSMIIVKRRTASTAQSWQVFHSGISGMKDGYIYLNLTNAFTSGYSGIWNGTNPTSAVFSVGNDNDTNASGGLGYVAYCFAPIAGYSAFGSYTGNGSTDGAFIYTGFRPRYILVKPSSTTGSWLIHDAARDPYNVSNLELQADTNLAEYNTNTVGAGNRFDLLSNGFKNRSSNSGANGNGNTYIYAAFAENPFKYSLAR